MCYDIEIGLRCAQTIIATILGSTVNIYTTVEGSLSILKNKEWNFPKLCHMSILRWKVHFGTSWRWNWVPTTVTGRDIYTCDHIKEMSRIFFSFPSSYNFCISTPIMVKLEMTNFVIRNYSLTRWENLIWFNTLNCLWCWKCCPQQLMVPHTLLCDDASQQYWQDLYYLNWIAKWLKWLKHFDS